MAPKKTRRSKITVLYKITINESLKNIIHDRELEVHSMSAKVLWKIQILNPNFMQIGPQEQSSQSKIIMS